MITPYHTCLTGTVAQLVEYPLCDWEVVSSIPGQFIPKTSTRNWPNGYVRTTGNVQEMELNQNIVQASVKKRSRSITVYNTG